MSYCRDETIARMTAQDAADCTSREWRYFPDKDGVFHIEPNVGPHKGSVVCAPRVEPTPVVHRSRVVRARDGSGWYVFAYDSKNERMPHADYETDDCDDAHRAARLMVADSPGTYCTNLECLQHVAHYYRVVIASNGKVIDEGLCLQCADNLSHKGKGRTVKHDHS